MIPRELKTIILSRFFQGKAILLLGPRQSGKTTLLKALEVELSDPVLFLNCDEPDIRRLLTEPTSLALKQLIGSAKVVMIDEAQRVKNIGVTLKLITDVLGDVQLVVTGSAALELAGMINEPLTGRKWEYRLLPLSFQELVGHHGLLAEKRLVGHRLVFGMYPDVVVNPGSERDILRNLADSYLFKDIYTYQDIRRPEVLEKLLEALALQVASEVSYHELAQMLGVDTATVQRYIELLEKTFVVFRLRSFSRNVRNELKKSRKIYFFDNGIRNALVANFNPPDLRTDIGPLWENFLVSERTKYLIHKQIHANQYFWRTRQQQEIDYIEERDGVLHAFEFKWNPKKAGSFSRTFLNAYPDHETNTIHPDNITDLLIS